MPCENRSPLPRVPVPASDGPQFGQQLRLLVQYFRLALEQFRLRAAVFGELVELALPEVHRLVARLGDPLAARVPVFTEVERDALACNQVQQRCAAARGEKMCSRSLKRRFNSHGCLGIFGWIRMPEPCQCST